MYCEKLEFAYFHHHINCKAVDIHHRKKKMRMLCLHKLFMPVKAQNHAGKLETNKFIWSPFVLTPSRHLQIFKIRALQSFAT